MIAGRYRVEEVLGRGGMGAVYRVRDARSGRQLALKRGFARDTRKTAKRTGAVRARVPHARAARAPAHHRGLRLRRRRARPVLHDGAARRRRPRRARPLPWREACALLRDVASSLALLHSRGLLHRDVSARNVRCTADGRAKLIDFGAMASIGVAKDVVGTPPFMPPEALQLQALDARADLFSLGALGYYLLTGRHAYPARRLGELRDVWRSRAAAAGAARARACRAALERADARSCSALDRSARPQSAAEVMERLCAIAGLPLEERAEVSRAYLTTPTLVGREQRAARACAGACSRSCAATAARC